LSALIIEFDMTPRMCESLTQGAMFQQIREFAQTKLFAPIGQLASIFRKTYTKIWNATFPLTHGSGDGIWLGLIAISITAESLI